MAFLIIEIRIEFGEVNISDLPFAGTDDGAPGKSGFILNDLIPDQGYHPDGSIYFFQGEFYFGALGAPDKFYGVLYEKGGNVHRFLTALGHLRDDIPLTDLPGFPGRAAGDQAGDLDIPILIPQRGADTEKMPAHLFVEISLF